MSGFLPRLPKDWQEALEPFIDSKSLRVIDEKLLREDGPIYPQKQDIFRALELTPFCSAKVVIWGQDPYHGANEACGLCFGVKDHIKTPPSLKNLMKELKSDVNQLLHSQELVHWAEQGVLLLNRTLTVTQGRPLSHKDLGWDAFSDAVMQALLAQPRPILFVALGKQSEAFLSKYKSKFSNKQKILAFAHPSPLSAHRGFWGSKMFSKINQELANLGLKAVEFGYDAKDR